MLCYAFAIQFHNIVAMGFARYASGLLKADDSYMQ